MESAVANILITAYEQRLSMVNGTENSFCYFKVKFIRRSEEYCYFISNVPC